MNPARLLRLGLSVLGLAWVSYAVILHGLAASALQAGDSQLALRILPRSTGALSLASEQALAKRDMAAAARYARAALVETPRDVRALRVMGIATSLTGRPLLGSELMLRAGSLSWRDAATQVWLIRAAIDQQNFSTATQRIDALLRSGQMQKPMLALMHQLAALPEARDKVVDRLVEDPDWRRGFFSDLDDLPPGTLAGHALLLHALAAREGGVQRTEGVWFAEHLIRTGEYRAARQAWLSTLTRDEQGYVSNVFDGDFVQDPSADSAQPRYPFEWTLETGEGATASVGTPPLLVNETALDARSGDSLRRLASQIVLLAPGKHVLAYDVIVGQGTAADAFQWRVTCIPHEGPLPFSVPTARTIGAWRSVEQDFTVPSDCKAQRLELRALAGAGDTGEAWFDHVSVR